MAGSVVIRRYAAAFTALRHPFHSLVIQSACVTASASIFPHLSQLRIDPRAASGRLQRVIGTACASGGKHH